jgi:Cytochrome c554 and c-prime
MRAAYLGSGFLFAGLAAVCLFTISGQRTRHTSPVHADSQSLLAATPTSIEEDNEEYEWVAPAADAARPQNCGNCHAEIVDEWQNSGHAHAAVNRRLLNLYDGTDWQGNPGVGWNLLADNPDGSGVCTSCHAPSVSFSDPAYFDLRQLRGTARSGVHCDYCHKISGVAGDQFGLTHGRFGLKLSRPLHGQRFFGPFQGAQRAGDVYSPIYKDSRYCASCHEGTVFGVPVYTTYSEWLESPAGKSGVQCQACHMTPTGKMTNMAPGHGGIERDPGTLGNHRFFDGSPEETLRRCLTVTTSIQPANQGTELEVHVQAPNVGHRVPTGFVDRNLVLVVEGFDQAGKPVQALAGAARLPRLAGKRLEGLPGLIYARQLSDYEGHGPAPFWQAKPEAIDTRLAPLKVSTSIYQFPTSAKFVQVRLLYRRFWPKVAQDKGWPDDSITVLDRRIDLGPIGHRINLR